MVANNTDTQKGDIINEHNYNKLLFRLKVLTAPKALAMETPAPHLMGFQSLCLLGFIGVVFYWGPR